MATTTPETPEDAAKWQTVCWSAGGVGLCPICAAQLAWGALYGFARLRQPCLSCQSRMRLWPLERQNGWRLPNGPLLAVETWNAVASG